MTDSLPVPPNVVTAAEADDMVRAAGEFVSRVENLLEGAR